MLKVYNYDFKNSSASISVKNINQFFTLLLKSPGLATKPVRIIENEETKQKLVAKFAFNTPRIIPLQDELRNLVELKNLTELQIAHLIWSTNNSKICVVCTKYIEPFSPTISTLRQVAMDGNERIWTMGFFQVLFTLLQLHQKYEGFRHNDLKADNVLVTKEQIKYYATKNGNTELCGEIRRVWKCSDVKAVIIDLEMAICKNKKLNSKNVEKQNEKENEFGLSYFPCEMFDVHLLIIDTIASTKNSKLKENLLNFISKYIPAKYFDTRNLTKQSRLKLADQKLISVSIMDLLIDPYFHEFRFQHEHPANYELIVDT